MTRPRLHPDLPRVCPEAKAWILAAKLAGAGIWQIATFVDRKASTCYGVLRRNTPRRRRPPPRDRMTARQWRRERQRLWVRAKRGATPPEAPIRRPMNTDWRDRKAAKGLERCERLLAEQRQRETPPIRRCPHCDGIEYVAHPHAHRAA